MSVVSCSTTSTTAYKVTADTTGTLVLQTGATPTTAVTIDASQNVGIGTSSPVEKLAVTNTALTSTTVGANTVAAFRSNATGADTNIKLSDGVTYSALIGQTNGNIYFSPNGTRAATIDTSGNLLVGTTTYPSATVAGTAIAAALPIRTSTGTYTGAGDHIQFYNGNGSVGYIRTNGTATSYVTSSDYRLKEDIAPMTGALTKVSALKPVTYKWKIDGSDGQGFIAHELAEVEAGCVTGEKDAVDADGNPQYQGIDTSFLVATLTAAIQEQQALITQLQADVAALKGAA